MPRHHVLRTTAIQRTPRVIQLEGLFDVPPSKNISREWNVDFDLPDEWNVGVIVGPSGSGKTTVAREMFGLKEHVRDWPFDKSIVDAFPSRMSIKEITGYLSAVGFSSPPAWLKPYHVLSNGEQFRVTLARLLSENDEISICDEFTSVVDRQVAQIASAALSKAIRRQKRKFVAVSCHYDILDWLEPDWVYEPHTAHFYTGRGLHQRPKIKLEIIRCERDAWNLFKGHHYLSADIHPTAARFVAKVDGVPAAFCAVLSFAHPVSPGWREHRTVCLPEFQGVGIGNALSESVASAYASTGKPFRSSTSSPAMIYHRARSPLWKMTRKPTLETSAHMRGLKGNAKASSVGRVIAAFEYIGPRNRDAAFDWGIIKHGTTK